MAETYFRDVHASRAAGLILLIAAATIAGAWIFQAFGYRAVRTLSQASASLLCRNSRRGSTLIFALRKSRALDAVGFILLFLIFAFSAGFGIYHAGVEWHFWEGPTACTGSTMIKATSMQDFLHQLQTVKVVRCDAVAIRILGLSLAGWNAVISAVLAVIAIWGVRKVG